MATKQKETVRRESVLDKRRGEAPRGIYSGMKDLLIMSYLISVNQCI